MEEEIQKKICTQCDQEKALTIHFYRTKNGKDGYMKMCIHCYKANKEEYARKAALAAEKWKQEQAEARRQAEDRQARLAEVMRQMEERRHERQAALDAWYAQQPARMCIACHETKMAIEFGYSELIDGPDGFPLPARLHQRCRPCHERMRERNLPPCVICHQGMKDYMSDFAGYNLFGGGTRIPICCMNCGPAFQAKPVGEQRFYIRSRVNALFKNSQVIYAEMDPQSQGIRYIGRTGHAKRRHSEHKRNIHQEQLYYRYYDSEAEQAVAVPWVARANWMYDLKQQGLEPKQRILLDVQPGAHVIEYERRYILHAIQQGWPILNSEVLSEKKAQSSTLDFLNAPFENLVKAGWFPKDGIEAFIRAWYSQ
jgi:hypothetical protein